MHKPYSHWAMPVKSYRWATLTTVLEWAKRCTGFRVAWLNHAYGAAHTRACHTRAERARYHTA